MPILRIRDKDGNFADIKAIKGNDGKSAYEQAKEGGYTGTEKDFITLLNGLTVGDINEMTPTYEEAAELETLTSGEKMSIAFGKIKKAVSDYISHLSDTKKHVITGADGSVSIGGYATSTDCGAAVGPSAVAKGGGAVGPDAKTTLGGSVGQIAISASGFAGGEYATTGNGGSVGQFAYSGDGFAGGKSAWTKTETHEVIDAIQLGQGWNTEAKTLQVYDYQLMGANGLIPSARLPIYHGSYQGVGGYGANNPNTITFPFKPKCVVISHPSSITVGSNLNYYVTLPLVYGCGLGFVSLSSSAREAPYNIPLALTWNGNTLSWYYTKTDNNGAYYQLNAPSETYNYVVW